MPGAGKDEFIRVAKLLGFSDYHMGNTVRNYAKKSTIPESDQDIGNFASSERKKHGMNVWAVRTLESLSDDHDKIVIDGLRNIEELDYFKTAVEGIALIAIFANRETRLARILKRHRPDDIRNMTELIERDERELSWGIGRAIVLADFLIVNDFTLDQFELRSRELIDSLLTG